MGDGRVSKWETPLSELCLLAVPYRADGLVLMRAQCFLYIL